ncbi:MAG: TonB-dependent receptor [Saprospiraceae bacterium]
MQRILLFLLLNFCSIICFSQIQVNGNIKDETGATLPGVNITERGTTNYAISDLGGNYSIAVRENATVVFSYMGFRTVEQVIKGNSTLDVVLQAGVTLDGVEILGSRSQNRTVTNTMVPVDVIDIREVTSAQGQLDMNQLLQYAAPSYNANRQSGADGSDHVDPASLRGLGPDQTLVLINGKRRHQSSLVNIYGTRGRGNTGTDLNSIPASAIKRIEILRDGASAQYGSDAIAGVINIVLRDDVESFSAGVNVGANLAKNNPDRETFDGENYQVNGNFGTKIFEKGFVNITTDYWYKAHTKRNDPSLYRQEFGDAQGTNFGTYFNAQVPVGANTAVYAFGGINSRKTNAFAWTRGPGEARNVDAIFPNGFNPIIATDIDDQSLSAGIRSSIGKWNVDFNHTYGKNKLHYFGKETVNASLEERSPTTFDDGGFQLSQNVTTIDFSRYYENLFQGSNIAFGVEQRTENYKIFAGEEASWKTYGPIVFAADSTFDDGGIFTGIDTTYRPGGAQGFPGFGPQNEVDESRNNVGLYFDSEFNFTKSFTVGAAARFENYSDFGSTINGKLSARYAISRALAIRASASTGFRAPSLAQLYFNSVYTDYVSGVGVDKFLAKNNSPITKALGIEELKEETSVNFGAGLTGSWGGLSASLDYYHIQIKDRIVLTSDFYNDDPEIGQVLRNLNVGSARFFSNAINTSTNGVDLILSYGGRMAAARYNVVLAGNFNHLTIDKVNTSEALQGKEDFYLSNREKLFILAAAPNSRVNLSFDYRASRWGANLRLNYFDKIELEDYVGAADNYDSKITLDLSATLNLSKNIRFTIGASNLLNTYPTEQDPETESGGLYDAVQMGSNGAFLFTKLGFVF